jgi:hypothetical protein
MILGVCGCFLVHLREIVMVFETQRGLSCWQVQGSDLSEFHCESFIFVYKPCWLEPG